MNVEEDRITSTELSGGSPVEIITGVSSPAASSKRNYKYFKGDDKSALQRRRERNREMAKKSRAKKKQEIAALEKLYAELVADNEAIKAYLQQFPEEMAQIEAVNNGSSSDDLKTPSAIAMLEHDMDLPNELVDIACKMLNSSFFASCTDTSSEKTSTGSLKELAVHSMHIGPTVSNSSAGPSDTSLDTSVIPLLIVNSMSAEYPIVYASPAFRKLTGYAVEELIGRNCGFFLHCSTSDPAEVERLHVAITKEVSSRATLSNSRKDGSTFLNEISVAHFYNKQHRSCQLVVLVTFIKEL